MSSPEQVGSLIEVTEGLKESVDSLVIKFDIQRMITAAVVAALALVILVACGLVWAGINLNNVQERQERETALNRTSQCAIVTMFLSFEPVTKRSPNYTEEQKAKQEDAFSTFRQIDRDLHCQAHP